MKTKTLNHTSEKITTLVATLAFTATTLLTSGCGEGQVLSGKAFTQFTFMMIPAPYAPGDDEYVKKLPVRQEISDGEGVSFQEVSLNVVPAERSFQWYQRYLNKDVEIDEEISAGIFKIHFVAESSSLFSEPRYKVSVIEGSDHCLLGYLQAGATNEICGDYARHHSFNFYLSQSEMTRVVQTFTNPEPSAPFEIDLHDDQPFKLKIHKSLTLEPVLYDRDIYDRDLMLAVTNAPAIEFLAKNAAGTWESRAFALIKRHCHSPELDKASGCDDLANSPGQAGHLIHRKYYVNLAGSVDHETELLNGRIFMRHLDALDDETPNAQAFERFIVESAQTLARRGLIPSSVEAPVLPEDYDTFSEVRTNVDRNQIFNEQFIGSMLVETVDVELPSTRLGPNGDRCLTLPGAPLFCIDQQWGEGLRHDRPAGGVGDLFEIPYYDRRSGRIIRRDMFEPPAARYDRRHDDGGRGRPRDTDLDEDIGRE